MLLGEGGFPPRIRPFPSSGHTPTRPTGASWTDKGSRAALPSKRPNHRHQTARCVDTGGEALTQRCVWQPANLFLLLTPLPYSSRRGAPSGSNSPPRVLTDPSSLTRGSTQFAGNSLLLPQPIRVCPRRQSGHLRVAAAFELTGHFTVTVHFATLYRCGGHGRVWATF